MDGVATRTLCCLLLTAALSGCGWWGSDEQAFDEDLPTLDAAVTSPPPAPPDAKQVKQPEADDVPDEPAAKPGTRVALRKRVVQTISQDEVVNQTTLDLDFTISIDEIVDDGARRFGVHYDRVRYSGEVGGEKFDYDSKKTSAAPYHALPFHGLVDNNFYFWIDGAGQTKLVGFDRFLRRCVERLPHADREAVLSRLSVISDAEGVSRFVDETIGLLPVGSSSKKGALKTGANWTSQRKLAGDVPMQILTEYTVKSLAKNDVEIEIRGVVGPSNQSIATVSHGGGPLVTLKGGKSIGTCTLDRRTGLPKSSRIEQSIDMSVELADGTRFVQKKRVVSTINPPDER